VSDCEECLEITNADNVYVGALCPRCAKALRARVAEYEEQERGLVAEFFALMERRDTAEARVAELERWLREIEEITWSRRIYSIARRLLGLEVEP